MRKLTGRPTSTDEYLAAVEPAKRAALQKLRRTILSAVPDAEECISYGLPAFRVGGRVLVWIGAAARHCAFYPGGIVNQFARELAGFETGPGTIRFQPDHPPPAALIRRIVKARVAQNAARKSVVRKRTSARNRRRKG